MITYIVFTSSLFPYILLFSFVISGSHNVSNIMLIVAEFIAPATVKFSIATFFE